MNQGHTASSTTDQQTLMELLSRVREHIPLRDLAKILVPPVLGYELLQTALEGKPEIAGDFDPETPEVELFDAVIDLGRWMSNNYFATTIEGVKNVPAKGPVMLVANHNAGLMVFDGLFAIDAIRAEHGSERWVHGLLHDFAYKAPTMAEYSRRMGFLRAKRDNARKALEAGRIVMVYPGGDKEAFRPFSERHRIVLAGRKGFIRLALELNVPIVPLVSVGLHESFLVLSRGERLAKSLGLTRFLHTDIMPFGLSLPWGLAPSFAPYLPAPTTVDMRFCEPIELEGSPDDEEVVEAAYALIESTMQSVMDELSENRTPWLGRPTPGA